MQDGKVCKSLDHRSDLNSPLITIMNMFKSKVLLWGMPIFCLLSSLGVFFCWIQIEKIDLSSQGGEFFLGELLLLLAHLALGVFFLSAIIAAVLLICVSRCFRTYGLFLIFCSILFFGGCHLKSHIIQSLKAEAFEALIERMTPLVAAIEQYKNDKGMYPEKLDSLIPGYLKSLPDTGMGNHKKYYYNSRSSPGMEFNITIPVGQGLSLDSIEYSTNQLNRRYFMKNPNWALIPD